MDRLEKIPGRTAVINGKSYLYFSGTSYLGLVDNITFKDNLQQGISSYSGHYGGSRLGSTQLDIFNKAESFLAAFTAAPSALIVSSGSLAGQLLLKSLEGKHYYFAPDVHPALSNGKDVFSGTFTEWVEHLSDQFASSRGSKILIANSIDPLHLNKFSFEWLGELSMDSGPVTIVVDDSHGLGVIGKNGAGIYEQIPKVPGLEVIVVSSLGKALGIPAGVILGSQKLIQSLWQSPFFGGASPPSPAYLHAMLQSRSLYEEALLCLKKNIDYFHRLLPDQHGLRYLSEYPVFSASDTSLADFLKEKGILISHLKYPTPDSSLLSRIIINAAHQQSDLEYLSDCLKPPIS